MTHLTLTLTDSNGIDGTVIAKLWDDDTLYDFDIVPDGEFSPTWKQVESALESSSAMPYVLPVSHLLYLSDNY